MCGITGFISRIDTKLDLTEILHSMTDTLSERGPDSKGYYENKKKGYFLGHRRLSIIELSDKGKQPMLSPNKRYVITFNGEIYNHNIIRSKLKLNVNWISGSDTESILSCFDEMGVEKSLELFSGMFAIAVIDLKEEKLYLARDYCGEKPVYYCNFNGTFMFSSQIKSLIKHPLFIKKINLNSLNYFTNLSYIPEPFSIFENTFKLEKGSFLKFDLNLKKIEKIQKFYPQRISLRHISKENYIDDLNNILVNAVQQSLVSDVEVGSFLSGGIDSSIITSIMQSVSKKKIKTFSASIKDKKYNESFFSRSISDYLGTEHNELVIDEKLLLDQAKVIPDIYDEPFADSSQIPTSLISKFASSQLKVMLSGDGADEFFGGYNRYIFQKKIEFLYKHLPFNLRVLLGKIINLIPEKLVNIFEILINKALSKNKNYNQIHEKLKKIAVLLIECKSNNEIYLKIHSNYGNKLNFQILSDFNHAEEEINDFISSKLKNYSNNGTSSLEMYLDQNMYLSGDILHKIDRGSMYYSLENRSPFLNPDVISFANDLPMNMKIKNGEGKWILRQILKKYIPEKFIQKPKRGFAIPIDSWMRKELKNWRNEILDKDEINRQGFINYQICQDIMNDHDKGKNFGSILWNLIIWQSWVKKYY